MNLKQRLEKLEEIVAEHLKQSGSIQTNLKWNTTVTVGIAVTVIGKLILDIFHK